MPEHRMGANVRRVIEAVRNNPGCSKAHVIKVLSETDEANVRRALRNALSARWLVDHGRPTMAELHLAGQVYIMGFFYDIEKSRGVPAQQLRLHGLQPVRLRRPKGVQGKGWLLDGHDLVAQEGRVWVGKPLPTHPDALRGQCNRLLLGDDSLASLFVCTRAVYAEDGAA